MAVQRKFSAAGGGSSGGAGFRGVYDSGTAYLAGDLVVYNNALWGAAADVTGTAPVSVANALSGTPGDTAVSDAGDYEFVATFTVSANVRLTHVCFYKSTLQTQVPHTLSLWDTGISTTTPLATSTNTAETGGGTGVQAAPLIADLRTGRTYAVSLATGTGTDSGYVRTTSVSLPITSGVVSITSVGFSTVVGNITTVTTGTTSFWVWPRWEAPSASWTLAARMDPAVSGGNRAVARSVPAGTA